MNTVNWFGPLGRLSSVAAVVVSLASILAGTWLPTAAATTAGSQAHDFALLDHNGKFHQLSYYGDQTAVVIFAHSNGETALKPALTQLQALANEYSDQDMVFLMLNSTGSESRVAVAAAAERLQSTIPILLDETQLVAETLGISQVGETLVIDPKTMRVRYRGPVQVSPGRESAVGVGPLLEEMQAVAGGATSESDYLHIQEGLGAAIEFAMRDAHAAKVPSYRQEIAPILETNCVSCHHTGGIGPWAMGNHAMVKGWSTMMREVLMTRRMPPGQIDPHVGKPIADVAGLSTAEMQTLVHWIDAGAPMDAAASGDDPLAALTFANPKYSLGEPDMILQVAPQTIPATGVIDYRYIPVELNLDRDVWVQAMEFVPGDRQVLHHVIAYLSSPADRSVRGRMTGSARGDSVGGFAPGRKPDAFRDNSGRLIPKGSNLLLQMHYTTSGKETVDATEIGLFLHDEPPDYIMAGGVAGQRRFLVPPGVKEHKLTGEQLIERDAYLYSMAPHMHFRGKYMNYSALYPDGRSELLLSVPKYDFNWQFSYELAEPLFLPAGSKLIARGAMDNSDRNPGNPDPTKPVHFGLQTKHEMFFGFTTLRYAGDTPTSHLEEEAASAASADSAGR